MFSGAFTKAIAVLCLALQAWVACAPAELRFCGRAIAGSEAACCGGDSEGATCCCDHSAPAEETGRQLNGNDCDCCVSVPPLSGPIALDARAGLVDILRVMVLPAGAPVLLEAGCECEAVKDRRTPPDPARARAAAGMSSTRFLI